MVTGLIAEAFSTLVYMMGFYFALRSAENHVITHHKSSNLDALHICIISKIFPRLIII